MDVRSQSVEELSLLLIKLSCVHHREPLSTNRRQGGLLDQQALDQPFHRQRIEVGAGPLSLDVGAIYRYAAITQCLGEYYPKLVYGKVGRAFRTQSRAAGRHGARTCQRQ